MAKVTLLPTGIGKPVVTDDITTVIVETSDGTPIVVVAEVVPGGFSIIPATDPDFTRILRGLGLNQVEVSVETFRPTRPAGELVSGPLLDTIGRMP